VPQRYSVYGVTLVSKFCLSLPHAEGGNDGIAITLEDVGSEAFQSLLSDLPVDPQQRFQQVVLETGDLYMRWRGWFDFVVSSDGRRVLCRNLSNIALERFEAYLTNFAISAALVQLGEEPLHSTVVEIEGRAIGLLGYSGTGKSTLASYLIQKRGDLVTDDMLRVTFEGQHALAHPGPYRLKLFKDPADRYLREVASVDCWTPGGKLIYELGDPRKARGARRLSAFYQLCRSGNEVSVAAERITGLELFKTISASSMNIRLHTPARLTRHFHFAERIAGLLPVYRLTYPTNFEILSQVAEHIYDSGLK
jgi:hypothetical protein